MARKLLIIIPALFFSHLSISGSAGQSKISALTSSGLTKCDIGAYALYMQPALGGAELGFGTFNNYSGGNDFGSFTSQNGGPNAINIITPMRNWGFAIESTYAYTASDPINISWYHYEKTQSKIFPSFSQFSGNLDGLYAGGPVQLKTEWNAVNLDFGKKLFLTETKPVTLYAGLAYIDINNIFNTNPKVLPTTPILMTTRDKLNYSGFGPRIRGDTEAMIWPHTNVYFKAASSLFVGVLKQNSSGYVNFTDDTYGLQLYGNGNNVASYHSVVIPELEAQIGLQYDYRINHNQLTLNVGYFWMSYINAIRAVINTGFVNSTNADVGTGPDFIRKANYTLNGFILGLNFKML